MKQENDNLYTKSEETVNGPPRVGDSDVLGDSAASDVSQTANDNTDNSWEHQLNTFKLKIEDLQERFEQSYLEIGGLLIQARETPTGVIVGLALIFAGAVGNILDSAFYGLLFSESTPYSVAHFGGHYAGFMMGKVVDMFYFPLFQWNSVPRFLRFLVDSNNYFFGAIFNLADAYISVAVVYLLLFQYKFLDKQ